MVAYARERRFPIVGPAAGATLCLLARLTDAGLVFEFGSGFGYSASWFFRGMRDDGRVVLTEEDADELDRAREFLGRAGVAERATFEAGDAHAAVEAHDGPFDVVFVDHAKHQYAEAFSLVREKVRLGGVVVADNVIRGPIDFDALLASVEGKADAGAGEGGALAGLDESTRGIASYLDATRADPAYETLVLPVGSGLAVSTRVSE